MLKVSFQMRDPWWVVDRPKYTFDEYETCQSIGAVLTSQQKAPSLIDRGRRRFVQTEFETDVEPSAPTFVYLLEKRIKISYFWAKSILVLPPLLTSQLKLITIIKCISFRLVAVV